MLKAHVGTFGNEHADLEVKAAVEAGGGTAVTEGGVRALVKERRKKERIAKAFCMGRVVRWSSRWVVIAYSQLRTGKGRLAASRYRIGRHEMALCRKCAVPKTGPHVAVRCMEGEGLGRNVALGHKWMRRIGGRACRRVSGRRRW